ncbi:carboxypeptidase regulatory-like domain-containing protein [Nocardioides sp. NPDC023903]|uniref:carboxypeptidase regulatory-like domain-containing protein n=1 Tax=Nocardioides sp. NPDC023903 TaxID=3157195 RepID=UPI003401C8A7
MKSLRALAGALAVLLAVGLLTLLGGASPAAALEGQGITGRVTDADAGAPIGGVTVSPYCLQGESEGEGYTYWGPCLDDPADPTGYVITTTTSADGTYELSLPPGVYRLLYAHPDQAFVREYYDNAKSLDSATDVTVVDSSSATRVDVALTRASTISGSLTDESGAPADGVNVNFYKAGLAADGSQSWDWSAAETTDGNGAYTARGLVPGDVYRIEFSDYYQRFLGEFYNDVDSLDLAADVVAGESGPVDAVLARDPGESIRGTITDDAGNPVAGVAVNAIRTDYWEPVGSTTSGEDGTYVISGLDPGEHRINFTFNDPYLWAYQGHLSRDVQVVTGAGAVADLSAYLGGQIAGTIKDANGQPIANAMVNANSMSGSGGGSARTDENGYYAIGRLPVGDYTMSFSAAGFRDEWYHDHWGAPSDDLDPVPVRAGETTTVDEGLAAEVSATGVVTYSDGGPLASEYVWVERQGDSGWENYADYRTDEQGRYTTGVLGFGTYRIKVRSPDDGVPTYSGEFTVTDAAQEIVRDVHLDWQPIAIVNTEAPAILGTGTVGQEILVSTGNWSTYDHLEIQWLRDGQPIGGGYGEIGETYRLTESDAGHEISARVTAIRWYGYLDGVATTEPLAVTQGQLTNSQPPAVTGTTQVGEMLGVDPGAWGTDGVTFAYQWLRDGTAIDGATNATYELVPGDYGHAISAEVTASKDTWASGKAVSSSVDVQRGDLVLAPSITGDVRIGKTLTASVNAPAGADVSYSWQVRSPASGSSSDTFKQVGTASSFTLADRYKNCALRLVVTVSATGYNDAAATVDISEQLR